MSRFLPISPVWLVLPSFLATGCTPITATSTPPGPSIEELTSQIEQLDRRLLSNQTGIHQSAHDSSVALRELEADLASLATRVDAIPRELESVCAALEPRAPADCDASSVRKVVVSDGKMVVGEVERVWIDPPGAIMIARIDTGAQSSSLHAENQVRFERDGDDWVRFEVQLEGAVQTLEREIVRFVRVYQQADPEGTRRPVIELRVQLGDVQDTFEFTLADRSHLDNEMLLGRNFLTDVAMVDVGKQFVQPVVNRPQADADSGR